MTFINHPRINQVSNHKNKEKYLYNSKYTIETSISSIIKILFLPIINKEKNFSDKNFKFSVVKCYSLKRQKEDKFYISIC